MSTKEPDRWSDCPDDRPIHLGVVGLGRAFTLMLPTLLADPRVRLAGACDPREAARRQFALDFGVPVYETIEALADDSTIEAIYIASPHQFHASHTCAVAKRRKHVLVEKPMALTLTDCDAMIEACHVNNVHLIVGHCHSFDSPYLAARRIIASGELGPPRMILALNYTDFLYRPRRPEELSTEQGGGVVFSQAAHQVDVVRMLAGSQAKSVNAVLGAWDPARHTEGAYMAMLQFESGVTASMTYSGYGHFDSDEWCGGIDEMGAPKNVGDYGRARRRLASIGSAEEEAAAKAANTYGGPQYRRAQMARDGRPGLQHQHFGPVIVSCDRGDLRPVPDGVWVYGDTAREHRVLPSPSVPRAEVIDELHGAVRDGRPPLHNGIWAKATLEICLALLRSARERHEVTLTN